MSLLDSPDLRRCIYFREIYDLVSTLALSEF